MHHTHYFFLTKISIHSGSSYMPVRTRVFCNRKGWFRSSVCPRRNNPRTKPACLRYQSSHAECRFYRSGSSGLVGRLFRLRLSNRGLSPRSRSCCIVSVGNGFGQSSGVVAVSCSVTAGGGDADKVAAFVVGIAHQFLAVEGDGGEAIW